MACGQQMEITETYWSTCWKWGFIPYPCKKSRTVTKYRYDFLPWRTRVSIPFHRKYEGCCGSSLYKWSFWSYWGTGNSGWNEFSARTEYFNSIQTPVGNCPFNPKDVID